MQALGERKSRRHEEELKNLISFTRGPSAWEELLKTEADIRKKDNKQFMTKKKDEENSLKLLW